jgi:type I restriction enzyme S subunit
MANDWRAVSLGELFRVKHGFAFKSEYFTDEPQATVLVTPGNFAIGGGFQDGKRKYYNGQLHEDYVLKPGQVVVTMTDLSKESDTLGYAASIPNDSTIWLHNQRVGLLEFKNEIPTSPRFVEYLLRTHEYRSWIVGSATGTTVKHTAPGRIESFTTKIPPIEEQRAIARILGTIDDKIELNRHANEALQAMARALFKAWFVDYEPVRAKLEGRWQRGQSLPGLPGHLYDVFPDRLVESELGEIPEGWRHSTIGEEVTVCGGSTPSTKEPEFWEGGQHCWATPKDLSALKFPVLLDTDRKITDAGLAKISSGLLPVGTVLLSSRAPIGYLAIAEVPTAINQGFIAMKCDGALPNVFVLQWCRESMDAIVGNANGSTFQEISKSNFRPLRVVVPSDPVLTSFTRLAVSLYRQLAENERESRSLAQLRDTLLPKLISGEVRVPDAERIVGAAV